MLQIMSAVSYLRALSDSQIVHISRIDNSIRFNQSITLHVCCLRVCVCVCARVRHDVYATHNAHRTTNFNQ